MENNNQIQQELQKECFNVQDICILFNVKICKGYKMLRQIKHYSDILEIPGRCHKKDYFKYINRFDKKN